MPDTFTFEDALAAEGFDFEEAKAEPKPAAAPEAPMPTTPGTKGAYDWITPSVVDAFKNRFKEWQDKSLLEPLGVTPENIMPGTLQMRGAPAVVNTALKAAWPVTVPASAAAKTAVGVANALTTPKGLLELGTFLTPAAPAVSAKWIWDMVRGGYESGKGALGKLKKLATDPQSFTAEDLQDLANDVFAFGAQSAGVKGLAGQQLGRLRAWNARKMAQLVDPATGQKPFAELEQPATEETKTVAEAAQTLPAAAAEAEKGITENAIKEGQQQGDIREERLRDDQGRAPEEPSPRGGVQPTTPSPEEASSAKTEQGRVLLKAEDRPSDFTDAEWEVAQDYARQGSPNPISKTREIKERLPKLNPENIRITVNQPDPQTGAGRSYAQVDEFHPTEGNRLGSNPEALRKLGVDIPSSEELITLPQGKYTLAQAREMLKKAEPPPPVTGEAPRQPVPTGAAPEGERAPAVSAAEPPGTTKGDISTAKEQVPVAGAAPPAGTTPPVAAAEGAAPGEQYGIAQRVRERLAAEGRTAPVEPGQGVAADVEVARGQQLNAANPGLAQKLLSDFEADPQKRVSADMIASTRAHGQELYKAVLDAEQKYGPNSPQYKAAWDAHSDWYTRTKPMQTEWHKMGQAQQGEVDVNTGTFTGLNQVSLGATGKGLPESDIPKAKLVAKTSGNADAKAKQAVINWHREWAIARAKAEVKGMVTEAKAARKAAEAARARKKKVLDDLSAIHRRLVAEAAKAETAAAVAKAGREKKAAEAARKIAQKKADAISAKVRRAASDAAKAEIKALGDPIGTVQKKAKEIIDRQSPDKGMIEPSDLINQIASDLNMPPKRVRDLLAQDKRSKYLMDEAWKKQLIARNLRTQAKVWAATRNIEPYKRALGRIPRLMFSLKVGLHGTVALGTHVPMVAFQPTFWKPYVQNFGRMYRMVGQPAYHQMQMNDLVRRPNWTTARRAGLVNDPFQFEDYNSPQTTVSFGRITGMGNRGYSVLKIIRQDMFDQHFDSLPDRLRKIPEVAAEIANNVNHATGVVKGRAPKGTNIGLFAPRLEASRVMWLLGDPIKAADTFLRWDKANEGEKWAAKQVLKERAWVLGTMSGLLALNQGFLKAIDSEQEINWDNPMKSDWLKFKVAGMNIGYGNAMISMARLPARMTVAIVNEGKFSKIVYEDENVYKILGSYARSQASPFSGTLLDLGFGRDYAERPLPRAGYGFLEGKTNIPKRLRAQGITEPYSWVEYGAKTAAFIPLQEGLVEGWQAIEDVWNGMGISEEEQKRLTKAAVIIGAMTLTGARVTEDVRY